MLAQILDLNRFRHIVLAIAFIGCTSSLTKHASAADAKTRGQKIQWEKWSDDLFDRAKREHKFVFLDLEAVWCHWCHVMDEVTYADPRVIALMRSRYIAVKVDQDSRPDLSNRYEDYGWPATIVFNENGGEIVKRRGYIPPVPMANLLEAIIKDPTPGPSVQPEEKIEFTNSAGLTPELRQELDGKLAATYDSKLGGWGNIHKFVDWDAIEYCMTRARAGDKAAANRARQTLTNALKLIDPVWGGVYQYSTDGDWDHPHFEKIMSFQAEVMRTYALAYAQFRDPAYLNASASIRRYIATFLTSPEGAFYVSQDADLVQGEHSAGYFALSDAARRKKGVPRVDRHVYARENGWAIRGILSYYAVSHNEQDLRDAIRAAEWVIAHRALPGGGFRHDERDNAGPYLADTLAMGRAFLALYEVTGDRQWLQRAQQAGDLIAADFRAAKGSSEAGYITAVAHGPVRPLPQIDENVAAARFFNLLRHYTGKPSDQELSQEAMRYLTNPKVARSRGPWMSGVLLADAEVTTEPLHVTVIGHKNDPAARSLIQTALEAPTGYRRIEWWDSTEGPLPNPDVQYPELPKAAAFLCTNGTCSSPIQDPAKLASRLNRARG
jgi:hypothetical protein